MADDPTRRFATLVAGPDSDVPLDEACLLIASAAVDDVEPQHSLAALDDLAAAVPTPTVEALRRHLFELEGFEGDRTTYHDPRNSLLPEVLERRLGIPITLAVVAMEVGRRIGVPLLGVGMPGHFLVRSAGDPDRFLDVFAGGAELDRVGCRATFSQLHPGQAWDDRYLAPVDGRTIVTRILANLANAYRRTGDGRSLCSVLELRLHLPGATDRDRRELALLLGSAGRFTEGAEVLEHIGGQREAEAAQRLRARLN